jgi:Na+/H+ antiporter NhaD/arsenite permease-like protein
LVGFFLAGLVVMGGLQGWWLRPLVAQFSEAKLFVGATLLSGFTDNAAVTYLGAQVPGVSASFKYALVAGAVAGGGLTVIANAPNPVAFAILRERFGDEGISPGRLFLAALAPTAVAMAFLWFA